MTSQGGEGVGGGGAIGDVAGLRADVYSNNTRGQEKLLSSDSMASNNKSNAAMVVKKLDFAQFDLPVIQPSEAELAAHDDVLTQMDKSSGGKTIWRKLA